MADMPSAYGNNAPSVVDPAELQARIDEGQRLASRRADIRSSVASRSRVRDTILNALLGAGAGSQAAEGAVKVGSPLAAFLSGAAGAAGAPTAEQLDASRAAAAADATVKILAAAPIQKGMGFDKLLERHPELEGVPLGYVHQIAPILERDDVLRREIELAKFKEDLKDENKPVDKAFADRIEKIYGGGMGATVLGARRGDLSYLLKGPERLNQQHEKQWETIEKRTNPLVAPRGSLLGIAGQGNARADRALTTLNSKNLTPQQISTVVADLAGIMQGGSPHEIALRQQGYDTLLSRFANLRTLITSKPSAANQPEVVQQLRDMVTEIKGVDNKIISDNLDIAEQTFAATIKAQPERWQAYRDKVLGTTKSPGESAAAPSVDVSKMSDADILKELSR